MAGTSPVPTAAAFFKLSAGDFNRTGAALAQPGLRDGALYRRDNKPPAGLQGLGFSRMGGALQSVSPSLTMQRTLAHLCDILAYVLALPALLALLPLAWLVWYGLWAAWLMLPLYLAGLALLGAYERIIRGEATRGQTALTWVVTIGFNVTVALGGWKLAEQLLGEELKTGLLGMIVEILAWLMGLLQASVIVAAVMGLLLLALRLDRRAKAPAPDVSSPEPPSPA